MGCVLHAHAGLKSRTNIHLKVLAIIGKQATLKDKETGKE